MRVDDVSIWRIGSYLAFPSVFSAGQVGTLNEQAWQDQVQWLADQGTVDMGASKRGWLCRVTGRTAFELWILRR